MTSKTQLSVLLLLIFLFVSAVSAQGPIDQTGEINGAPYRIRVPVNWNGTLLVYAHGYRDKADHPGEVDNRTPDIAPNSALADVLLAQGYALSGSAYRDNGWEVAGGVQDTKDLAVYFRDNIGRPDRTLLWAFSMGTVIAFDSMERFGGIYDGAMCGCAVGAGATQSWDSAGDLALAYATVFGMPSAWGTYGDVRDDLDFDTEVLAKLLPELSSATNFPRFEFLRLVTGTPGRGIQPPAPPNFYPNWVLTDMFFSMEARAELERRANGPIVQNIDRKYSLTPQERAYLNAIGVISPVIDAWLINMNANRVVEAPMFSRNYVARYANYSGRIKHPMLTMHTIIDPLVTVSQEYEYRQTVEAAGREKALYQVYTNGNGHCAFTGPQLLTAVSALDNWVRTQTKPTAASFPEAFGFDNRFEPPPMNQP
ncbi:MAG: hypothetical protein HOP17_18075 [Acidobacteria bacterium]|nr:hypothetical protein [Acidobacteriota bacterium]